MTQRACQCLITAVVLSTCVFGQGIIDDRVVGVYATRAGGVTGQGSGFLISDKGHVLTCYHVIIGAQEIKISYQGNLFYLVIVESIAPDADLAVLRLIGLSEKTEYFECKRDIKQLRKDFKSEIKQLRESLRAAKSCRMVGYSRILPAGPQQEVSPDLPQRDLVSSTSFRGKEGEPIFLRDINVLLLSATVYDGFSGSPVLLDGTVVGVFSGSVYEGGTTAWAIPLFYMAELEAIDVATWKPQKLYADIGWYGAVSRLSGNIEVPLWLSDLVGGIKEVEPRITKYQGELRQTHALLGTLRELIHRMLKADEITREDFDEFSKLKSQVGKAVLSLDRKSRANDKLRFELITLHKTFLARVYQDEEIAAMNRAYVDRLVRIAKRLVDPTDKTNAVDAYVLHAEKYDEALAELRARPQKERTFDKLRGPLRHLSKAYENLDEWFQLTANLYTDMRQACRDMSFSFERIRFRPYPSSAP